MWRSRAEVPISEFLGTLRGRALSAAAAATCADRQGKFWEMHDRLFPLGKQLTPQSGLAIAHELRLDARAFESCLVSDGPAAVQRDMQLADALQVTGTPTFLIGTLGPNGRVKVTHRFSGSHPLAKFKAVIDPLLPKSPTE
jgi:protein-disulfide isomerase